MNISKLYIKVKEEHDGFKRYKTRLIVKSFKQKKIIDYKNIFSLFVKLTTVWSVLNIVVPLSLFQIKDKV